MSASLEPPAGVLPGILPDHLLLVHDEGLAVVIGDIRCYPAGLCFRLRIVSRAHDDQVDAALRAGLRGPRAASLRPGPSDRFVLAVSPSSDGSIKTTVLSEDSSATGGLSLHLLSGGGGDGSWDIDYWLTPLPLLHGDTTFRVSWTRGEIDGSATLANATVAAAAGRAVELWPTSSSPNDLGTS